MKIKTLLEACVATLKKSRQPILTKLLEECDESMKKVMEDDMPPDASMPTDELAADAPAEAPAAADPDQALKDGFRAAMMAVIDDETMDAKGKLAKLKELLTTHEKLTAAPEPPVDEAVTEGEEDEAVTEGEEDDPPEPDADDKKETKESRAAKRIAKDAETVALREELAIRDLIESSELKFAKPAERKVFIKSLVPLTESERKQLIECRKVSVTPPPAPVQRPRSQGPTVSTVLTEAKADAGKAKFPLDAAARKKLVSLN